ncbi:hypothetical protein Leryth_006935 [Lithospermum erythrorhizon]|nr:hypothetical protein Leryth_006935 [Lithospermum erythrorhizon]
MCKTQIYLHGINSEKQHNYLLSELLSFLSIPSHTTPVSEVVEQSPQFLQLSLSNRQLPKRPESL